ncbi:uncharacterized protein LAJ45_04743 [Morchella importuna]|uniref:uncharacterized protein n=1 Tax=Morchella importuna TaxID=1174673 RepID=UPI001E8DC9C1|nr:uncharacterized protein LAJ45_04743 [Morchella importuna]KAH8151042.1 hypothetical protein LAJ45_04743 [Morchella importuna]
MASLDSSSPIASLISSLLPTSISLTLHHLSTPPTKTSSLFSPPPGQKAPTTTLETHFLSISHDGILVFAIEVLIYTIARTGSRTFFVSKADSSGYLSLELASFTTPTGERKSTLRTIATAFVRHLFNSFREADPSITATISLFARSQTQYLFPNSAVNEKKHVLTDRGLIAWWCKVLDPILQEHASSGAGGAKGYLIVPGFDRLEVRPLLPPVPSAGQEQWVNGHPYKLDAEADITVREVIPHFPDDPKARFLDELGSDEARDKAKRGQGWKNVRTIEQFWELMSFRQECSLGRCVGFLWVVLDGEGKAKVERRIKPLRKASSSSSSSSKQMLKSEGSELPPDVIAEESGKEPKKSIIPPLDTSGAIKPELQPIITTISTDTAPTSEFTSPEPLTPSVFSPTLSPTSPTSPRKSNKRPSTSSAVPLSPTKKLRTTNPILQPTISLTAPVKPLILLDEKQYTRVIDSLLNHADFGDKEKARRSSVKWLEGAAIAAGKEGAEKESWGVDLKGLIEVQSSNKDKSTVPGAPGAINVLSVRKKPKPTEAAVNTLPTSLIRRKSTGTVLATEVAKTTAEVEKEVDEQGRSVNVLGAGLLRKKAKPATAEEAKTDGDPKSTGETERLKKNEEAEAEVDKDGRKVNILGKEFMRKKEKAAEETGEKEAHD